MPTKRTKFSFGNSPVMVAPEQGGSTLNIYVFGEISDWWGVNKNSVLRTLKGNAYAEINLIISSNGGDLAEALVIRDLLKAYPANVTTYLTGICASAATILADAGNRVVMSRQCVYMVHKPLFQWTGGNADDLRKDANILDVWEKIAVDIYVAKTGLSESEVSSLMQDVSWMGADEALLLGFVDEVVDVLEIDFELDSPDNEDNKVFICDPIYFKENTTIYNQAVTNALKGGYRQISPAMMQGFQTKKEKNFDMKEILKSVVAMLVSAGFISTDKQDAAMEEAGKLEAPEMLANLVKEEVAKQVKNVAPSMKVTDIAKMIGSASEDERADIAKVLNIVNFDATELEKKVTDLSGAVAKLIVGEGGGADSNGEDGLSDKKDKKGEPSYKEKEHAKMYMQAFEAGNIDAATFKTLTGQDAPKRGRVSQN